MEPLKLPKVSVIIPTFNRSGLIQRAINSVFQQTYRSIEIIVCDDGSTDNTVEVVKAMQSYAELPLRLEILPCNLGVSAARNRGIFLAQGELIAFLDSDDIWIPEKLAKQVAFLDADSSYIGVGGGVAFIKEDSSSEVGYSKDPCLNELNELFKLFYECYISTSCFLVKKDALVMAGLFDLRLKSSEDRDLWWRLPSFGRIGFINEPLISYLIHENKLSNSLCNVTGKTYIPSIMKTVWYWRDKLTKKQIRQILAKAHLLVACDASEAKNQFNCIKHAVMTIYYGHLRGKALKLAVASILNVIRLK